MADGRRIDVQGKRYAPSNRVRELVIYAVDGTTRAYHRCEQAPIITTSSFTPAAQRANPELDHPLRQCSSVGAASAEPTCVGEITPPHDGRNDMDADQSPDSSHTA
ncbi:restriction endonuclease [Streptomyces sp. NPDC101227]|uniref:restriction endonuclease n=1 Tax=Streptomyces sp. NPDC101227 TaxID=3366136 RepID=UPI00381D2F8A